MPRQQHRRRAHYDVDATITPETRFKVSLLQLIGIAAGIFSIAVGYVYLVYNVTDIRDKQNVATLAIKDQEEKRTQLGKQLVESNEKIASSVNTLATQMAVQQERQKSTDEKLEKVLTQISEKWPPRR